MMQRRILTAILLVSPIMGLRPSVAADATASQDGWIPDAALAVLEISKPDPLLDRIFDTVQAVQGRGAGGSAQSMGSLNPGWTNLMRFIEMRFKTTGEALLRRLVRDGVVLAFGPGGSVVAVAQSGDAQLLAQLNDAIVATARLGAAQKSAPDPVTEGIHTGVPYWSIRDKEFHAIVGDRLIVANQLPALKAVLNLKAGAGGSPVSARPEYRKATHAAEPGAVARLMVSPALLQFLRTRKPAPDTAPNPMVELLVAGYGDAFGGDGWVAADLSVQGRTLALHVTANGPPPRRDAPSSFAWPADVADGARPAAPIPGQIASVSLFRDLRGFYAAKDALFPERTSQLILFENMMGIYFSGRDLTDDVMGAVDPHIRLVVAEPAYAPAAGTPTVRVPAFALVFRMRDPVRFGPVMEEAWQKALGMVNFTRGQNAKPGLIIDRRDHGGVRYSCAAFSAAEEPDKSNLDVRFNFRPSIAYAGESLILGSTDRIVDDLIDASKAAAAPPAAGINSHVELNGGRIATLLEANREYLVRQNMLKKGREHEQAGREMATMISILRGLGSVSLRAGARDGRVTLDLAIDPGPASAAVAGPVP